MRNLNTHEDHHKIENKLGSNVIVSIITLEAFISLELSIHVLIISLIPFVHCQKKYK